MHIREGLHCKCIYQSETYRWVCVKNVSDSENKRGSSYSTNHPKAWIITGERHQLIKKETNKTSETNFLTKYPNQGSVLSESLQKDVANNLQKIVKKRSSIRQRLTDDIIWRQVITQQTLLQKGHTKRITKEAWMVLRSIMVQRQNWNVVIEYIRV